MTNGSHSGVTVAYDDSGDGAIDITVGTLNQDTTGSAGALTTARTIHGVSFDGSANIDLSETIQDTVGAMFSGNTETGVSATYQDSDGTIDLVVSTTASTITDLTESVEDIVGAMVSSNTENGISVTYDDSDGTLDFNVNDPTISLTGDVTGSGTMTDLGNVSFATTIAGWFSRQCNVIWFNCKQ